MNYDLGISVDLGLSDSLISDRFELLVLECLILALFLIGETLCTALLNKCTLLLISKDGLLLVHDFISHSLSILFISDCLLCPQDQRLIKIGGDYGRILINGDTFHLTELLVVENVVIQAKVLKVGLLRIIGYSLHFLS
jgi:hypothetical protein